MSAHSHWRIYCSINNGNTQYSSLSELEFLDANNVNLATGGTPLASSNAGSSFNAEKVFDNNNSTQWISASNQAYPFWISYHFVTPANIYAVAITASGDTDRAPKDFLLQYSDDGSNWTTLLTVTNEVAWSASERRVYYAALYVLAGSITESLPITDWRVSASRCSDGELQATGVVSGSSYSLNLTAKDACNITLSPKIDYPWTANKVAEVNDYIVASNPDATPHLWQVTSVTGDASLGATEPAYNLSGTTTSGNVTLTYVSPLVDPKTLGPKIPTPV